MKEVVDTFVSENEWVVMEYWYFLYDVILMSSGDVINDIIKLCHHVMSLSEVVIVGWTVDILSWNIEVLFYDVIMWNKRHNIVLQHDIIMH